MQADCGSEGAPLAPPSAHCSEYRGDRGPGSFNAIPSDLRPHQTPNMFESLRHWLESIRDESKLFEHTEDEVLHSALASLLYHFIALDARHGGREKHEFDRIMKQQFELSQEQVDHLYRAAKASSADPHEDLRIIDGHLKDNPTVRLHFMQKLLELVDVHGAQSEELKLFHETLREVFPEVKDLGPRTDL